METLEELLAQADEQQRRILQTQQAIERMEIAGRSRSHAVTAKLRGSGVFTEVVIDPRVLDRYDAKAIGGFVLEAVNDGLRRLGEETRARYAPFIEEADVEI